MIEVLQILADATTNCIGNGNVCETGLPQVAATGNQLRTILQIIMGVLAAVAVLMVTIGGFRYVTSEGNPENTKKARSTIVYALIGLVVAISAEAIVSFFLNGV